MENLMKLADEVQGLMKQWSNIDKNKQRVQTVLTRDNQICKLCKTIDIAVSARNILNGSGVIITAKTSASKNLINKCQQFKDGFDKDWETIAKDITFYQNFLEPVKLHIENTIVGSLTKDWYNYCDSTVSKEQIFLIKKLPNTGIPGEKKREFLDKLKELIILRNKLPDNIDEIDKVIHISKLLHDLFMEIDEFPKSVVFFFMQMENSGAKIIDLTDEVKLWLIKNDMIDQLRIRLV